MTNDRLRAAPHPAGDELADGSMVLRWAASALLNTEKNFRRVMGYVQLWMLKAYLDEEVEEVQEARRGKNRVARHRKAG